jgi:DNA repair exonuclease SbcCD ATPase subunit
MEENITKGKELKVKWENRKSDLDGSIKDAQASLAEIKIDNNITAGITSIASAITDIEKSLSETETSLNTIRASIMRFESDLSARAEVEKDIETAKERREALIVKISRWRYLQIGCGKTGLQNLRIDGAAPKIIYNANRLLAQAYGARYSVRLETQNEDGKEDLQIKIIMENGKEIYLDDISGGQRAWNVQSLWLAMSLLNQEKSGKKYDYFCSDESDGALDVENAVKYTALYRPFMAEGHLNQLIYISHKPECRSMADHILMFEAGKNPAWN